MVIIIFSIILIFSFHYVRTFSQSRYEAVTFECIVVSMYISLANLFFLGFSFKSIYLYSTIVLIGMLILNTYHQYKYLDLMKARIEKVINGIIEDINNANKLNDDKGTGETKKDVRLSYYENLREIALIVIAPTFSSFIEENEFFNNPGGLIGMTKAMLGGRKRFHKKKYEMREKIAKLLNLAGPYDISLRKPQEI